MPLLPRRFLPAALLVAVILATAPFLGVLRDRFFDAFPRAAFRLFAALLATLALLALAYAVARIRRHRLARYGALIVALGLVALQTLGSGERAEVNLVEKIHVFEYGLLAFLLYRAYLREPSGADLSLIALPLLWVAVAGSLDETVQFFAATRTGYLGDVVLNLLSGVCGLLFALAVEPPAGFAWRLGRRRRTSDVAALALLVFGLFYANAHLGHRIEDPEIGSFRSWSSREALLREQALRRARWAENPPRALSPWQREDLYLTEAGWQTSHRDRSYRLGRWALALQANRILEKYYAPYLDLDGFRGRPPRRYPPERVRELERRAGTIDPAGYASYVLRRRVHVWISKPLFLALLLPAAALVWGLPRLAERIGRSRRAA